MIQEGLFPTEQMNKQVWAKDEMVLSVDTDQGRILRNIMKLHNRGEPFELDPTYSKGVFYKNLPKPKYKFDLEPQVEGVEQADARHLPLADSSVGSVVFDPPFKASNSKVKGIVEQRFTAFPSVRHLWDFYYEAMVEFKRVLKPGGLLVIKCQDTVSSGENHMSHFAIEKFAEALNLKTIDLSILLARSTIWSPNQRNQQHARKTHSFFLVFRKSKWSDK